MKNLNGSFKETNRLNAAKAMKAASYSNEEIAMVISAKDVNVRAVGSLDSKDLNGKA